MKIGGRIVLLCLSMVFVLTFGARAAQAQLPVNLSGYEIFPGVECTIGTGEATCGVTFTGWTGGNGPVEGGWRRFPGDRQGLWSANINYAGTAAFGSAVQLLGGRWKIGFRNGTVISGHITGGNVHWPQTVNASLGCGNGIATVTAFLTIADAPATFEGCLHDLPVGNAIPPKAWGTLSW